jgi:hypothetical protein
MKERTVQLTRLKRTKDCILGTLLLDTNHAYTTLERDWQNNRVSVSCIPHGLYRCVWQESARFGWCYEVRNVLDRSRILIHPGNTKNDSAGCILLGNEFGSIQGNKAVLHSRSSIKTFNSQMKKQNFKLEITNAY